MAGHGAYAPGTADPVLGRTCVKWRSSGRDTLRVVQVHVSLWQSYNLFFSMDIEAATWGFVYWFVLFVL